MAEQVSANETMAALLLRVPEAARVLLDHRMHCVGCDVAPFETIAEACAAYDVPVEQLLEEIERARRA